MPLFSTLRRVAHQQAPQMGPQPEPESSPVLRLPSDILGKVFAQLDLLDYDVAGRVCRAWRAASREPSLQRQQLRRACALSPLPEPPGPALALQIGLRLRLEFCDVLGIPPRIAKFRRPHDNWVRATAAAPSGTYAASADICGPVTLWHLGETVTRIAELPMGRDVAALQFSPCSRYLIGWYRIQDGWGPGESGWRWDLLVAGRPCTALPKVDVEWSPLDALQAGAWRLNDPDEEDCDGVPNVIFLSATNSNATRMAPRPSSLPSRQGLVLKWSCLTPAGDRVLGCNGSETLIVLDMLSKSGRRHAQALTGSTETLLLAARAPGRFTALNRAIQRRLGLRSA